jgi:hypothetical protein
MGRTFIRQAVQIAPSDYAATPSGYNDSVAPTLANYESTRPANLEDDLNSLRSQLNNLLNRNGASFPSGPKWYEDLVQPTALENGTIRGVDATNAALHAVEKKRVLRDVWKLLDIYPGLDLSILLVNDLRTKYEAHRVLVGGGPVHGSADATNTIAAPAATNLATAITLANDIKAKYNAHRVDVSGAPAIHGLADTTNVVSSANATNLATLITLINEIRVDYEAHRQLIAGGVHTVADGTNIVTALTVGSTTQVHIFTAAQLPLQTLAAIGAVTTLGTVAAQATAFGTAGLDEVVSTSDVNPKNMMQLVDAASHLDPILVGGKQLFALFQTESATDGSTMTGTTPNRAQLSFVVRNNTGDDLELVSVPIGQGINFATRERMRLEGLDEQDFLKGATVEFPASTTVTRQIGYDNQGVTPVEMATNSYLDLGTGLEWTLRDVLNAALLRVIEGSPSANTIQLTSEVDVFDINAVLNDFLNGASFDTGAAGTTINVGVTPNQIDAGGPLTVASGGSGDLKLDAANEVLFDDVNRTGAGWTATSVKLSDTTQEWIDYRTEFGEVSIFNALYQAKTTAKRVKGQAKLVANRAAGLDVDKTTTSILDVDLPNFAAVGTFVDDVDVYLNGELLRNEASYPGTEDVAPGSTPAQGMLKFEFALRGTGSKPDQLSMIVWGS